MLFSLVGFSSGDTTQWTASLSAASTPRTGGRQPQRPQRQKRVHHHSHSSHLWSFTAFVAVSPRMNLYVCFVSAFVCVNMWLCTRRRVIVFAAASACLAALPVCMSESGLCLSLPLLTLGGLTQTTPLLSKCSVCLWKEGCVHVCVFYKGCVYSPMAERSVITASAWHPIAWEPWHKWFNNENQVPHDPILHNTNSVIVVKPVGCYKDTVLPYFTWQTLKYLYNSPPLMLSNFTFPPFSSLCLSQPFPCQGVWLCSQEARQLGRERLPPVCRVGPRTTCLCHRQLYQQGHAVAAPIEGDKEREPKSEQTGSDMQLTHSTASACVFWIWAMTLMPSLSISWP